jgi:hypothetical protein
MWAGNRFVLTDVENDSIFSIGFDPAAPPGSSMEFKYVIIKSDGPDIWEQYPQDNNPPFGNRKIELKEQVGSAPITRFDLSKYFVDRNFKLSVDELHEDFQQLRLTIEGLHPALYNFTSKNQFDSLFDATKTRLNQPMPASELLKIVSPLVTAIGCGHSNISLPDEYWYNQSDHYFPMKLFIKDDQAFILTGDPRYPELAGGSELLSINGTLVKDIIEYLYTVIPSDGNREGYKSVQLSRYFSAIYAGYYGFPERFTIIYRKKESADNESIELKSVSKHQLADADRRNSGLSFDVLTQNNSGLLTINHFDYYQDLNRFTTFIDSVFHVIKSKNLSGLILDLRNNAGGDPFSAAYLFSYLISSPLPYFAGKFGKYAKLAEPIIPHNNSFSGELFILTNGGCFSTTGHLCALLKYHQIGRFVGEETGGTYTCNDAKAIIPLKNSMLRLQVAQRSFAVAVEGMDIRAGVKPDFEVSQSVSDYIQGIDTVKEYAIRVASGE